MTAPRGRVWPLPRRPGAPAARQVWAARGATAEMIGKDGLVGMSGSRKPGDRLLTRAEVERRTGLGRSTLYRLMTEGKFPRPLRVGRRAVRWSEREVEAWIASLPRSEGDADPR